MVKGMTAPKLLLDPSERNAIFWCSTKHCYTKKNSTHQDIVTGSNGSNKVFA